MPLINGRLRLRASMNIRLQRGERPLVLRHSCSPRCMGGMDGGGDGGWWPGRGRGSSVIKPTT